jgi:ABC-type dipeptide/oligopeptide/nickel transport system permease component
VARFLVLRLVQVVVVMFVVSSLLFFLMRSSGDPVALLAGENADPAVVAKIRQAYGFDDPLPVQYGRFLAHAVQLDFGDSLAARTSALGLVMSRVPASAELIAAGFVLAVVVAVPLGIVAAVRRGSPVAMFAQAIGFLGQSIPSFSLGLVLILVFAVWLHLLPSFGAGSAQQLVLPAVTLGMVLMAKTVRMVRSGMLDVLTADYVRTARAKGLADTAVVRRHALRNALLPVVTVLGVDLSALIGGTVVVETIFAWPGLGRQLVDAITSRDYPVVQATVFFIAFAVVFINTLVDVVYRVIDPRIRLGA